MSQSYEPLSGQTVDRQKPAARPAPALWERIALWVSYGAALLYTYCDISAYQGGTAALAAFALILTVGTELVCRKQKRSWESYVWLGCLWVIVAGCLMGRNQVWGEKAWLFLHLFAVYYVLVRSGRLLEGETGRFFLLDGLNALIVFPLKRLFLRAQVLWDTLACAMRPKGKDGGYGRLGTVAAILVAMLLFWGALALLSAADDTFDRVLGGLIRRIRIDHMGEFVLRLMVSLPVGAYLYGLVAGTQRESPALLAQRGSSILAGMSALRRVPSGVWTGLMAGFVLLYMVFFGIQGGYLFGAFTHTLPADFTVAQYARQGFFELCWIVGLNFTLLAAVMASGSQPLRRHKPAKIMATILLAQCMLFALIAFSKLYLYISCFGFTPLRLQSSWLVTVIAAGCLASLYGLWSGRKVSGKWLLFSAVSLALLHLV